MKLKSIAREFTRPFVRPTLRDLVLEPTTIAPNAFDPNSVPGLIQALRIDQDVDGTTLYDERTGLGDARDIQPGRAASFNGSSSVITVADSDDFSFGDGISDSPFTISAHILTDSLSGIRGIIGKDGGGSTREWAFILANNRLRLFTKDAGGSNQQSIDSTTLLTTATWYHAIATYDGRGGANAADGMSIYIDTVQETPFNVTKGSYTAMANTSAPLTIGNYGSGSAYWLGEIFDPMIFDRVLTTDEMLWLKTQGDQGTDPTRTNIVEQWHLDEGAGSTHYGQEGHNGSGANVSWHTGSDVPFSYQNRVGFTLSGSVYIPRDENNTTNDITGSSLQYAGKVPMNASLVGTTLDKTNGVASPESRYMTSPYTLLDEFNLTNEFSRIVGLDEDRILTYSIAPTGDDLGDVLDYIGKTGIGSMIIGSTFIIQ